MMIVEIERYRNIVFLFVSCHHRPTAQRASLNAFTGRIPFFMHLSNERWRAYRLDQRMYRDPTFKQASQTRADGYR